MDKKESNVFGIPLAVVFFVAGLALLIDGYVWFFVFNPLKVQLSRIEGNTAVIEQKVFATPTVEPTATPSATLTPEVKYFQRSTVTPVVK